MSESLAESVSLEQAKRLFEGSPHGALLGLELVELGESYLIARVPYRPELVGNPETGHMHGGVITTLIDQSCGAAVIRQAGPDARIVTLDLRVDHVRPAEPGRAVYARCECYRMAREVAFARAVAYDTDPDRPVATSMSAFMRLQEESARG